MDKLKDRATALRLIREIRSDINLLENKIESLDNLIRLGDANLDLISSIALAMEDLIETAEAERKE